jgi:hypothetical protein
MKYTWTQEKSGMNMRPYWNGISNHSIFQLQAGASYLLDPNASTRDMMTMILSCPEPGTASPEVIRWKF